MFRWFETRIDIFKDHDPDLPPTGLLAFYWHYVKQARWTFAIVLVTGFLAALVEILLFAFVGQLVDLVKAAENPSSFLADHSGLLLWMAFVALIARPVVFGMHTILVNQGIEANFTNLVRWQTHRYVLRQSLSFFQNDFAGRIANKIMQTGASLRETVVQLVDVLWFVLIYTVGAGIIFFQNDPRLMAPLVIWLVALIVAMVYFVPRIKERAAIMSEARSLLTGRIVDSYTNILTVKLFAHADKEDDYARDAITEHTQTFHDQLRLISLMEITVWCINGVLIVATCGLAVWLWSQGLITIGAIALVAGLVLRINNMAGWIMWVITGIFENIGTVQDGITTISQPREVIDRAGAKPLVVDGGAISFDGIRFHYGRDAGVIDNLTLDIAPGEKVGLVGRSGAGKSTLVNLLLRFHDLDGGRILIDGQDIAKVTQDSLRAHIGMVTQDTSLLHRSVTDNILYGRPDASEEQMLSATSKAHALDFVGDLVDPQGRKGFEAHVGERGVKLSGGQRQRIAIARVLLKDAPILILDEATSALDSEVEAEIQEQLINLMQGKTVIAIAHRLSTIAAMDRLVVMEAGHIVEVGRHDQLIARGGIYAGLWARQSGGFLAQEAVG